MSSSVRSVIVVAVLVGFTACGAQSERNESSQGDGSDAGDAGTAGSGAGGSAGALGGGAGRASGGSAGAGGSVAGGTGGVSGSAGMAPDYTVLPTCLQPIQSGNCNAAFPRYGFDQESLRCVEFIWGGCDANANNFETLEECDETCEVASDCYQDTRPVGCPCTEDTPCNDSTCSNAFYETGPGASNSCPPSLTGVCAHLNEAECVCPLEGGREACGA